MRWRPRCASAGFQAERQDQAGGLSDMFPDIGEGLAEWIVTAAAGEQMLLQLAYFDRGRQPVVMDIGPVLDLEDAVGGKVCALASRVEPRDYADVAAALETLQPGPADRLCPAAGSGPDRRGFRLRRGALDQMDDAFTPVGLSKHHVARLRERFAAWPRLAPQRHADPDAQQARLPDRDTAAGDPEPPDTDLEAGQ